MSEKEFSEVAQKLLQLPHQDKDQAIFEWDWRVALKSDCKIGAETECIYELTTIKRASGVLEAGPAEKTPFDRINIILDVNTAPTPLNVRGRFGGDEIKSFFSEAIRRHERMERQVKELTGV
jgi:hypothetical protein